MGATSPHPGQDEAQENIVHDYCIQMYDALKQRASKDQFVGSVTEVYATLGISNQYYSKILRGLVESGSVEHLQRGHHNRPTIYRLIHRPTKAQLAEIDFLVPVTRRNKPTENEILRRLDTLEGRVRNVDIVAALKNLEQRITALEKKKTGGSK